MADIRDPRLLYFKGVLFLVLGVLASAMLLLDRPSLRVAALLSVAIWSFCRAYYFAFYVVERYADPTFKFDGLASFARYLARRRPRADLRDDEP